MTRHLCSLVALSAIAVVFARQAEAASWIFQPSSFTHNPATGKRVAQFAPNKVPYVRSDPSFRQSAYRNHRSTINVGGSADRLHIVETWGEGEAIRPYGEWQRPYREGATPYGPWGNPQGPWTTPYGSWRNPYGLGRLPYPPWPYAPYGSHHAAPPVHVAPGDGEPPEAE